MHKHQLRQQPFPIPLKEEQEEEGDEGSSTNTSQSDLGARRALMGPATTPQRQPSLSPSSSTTNSHQATPETLTITTLNAESTRPLQLALRIRASILPHPPQRLIPKLSQRLYNTPTYGPETDWLRAALCMLHDGLLEPGFDVDKFFEYINSADKEYALYEASSDGDAERDDDGGEQPPPHLHAATRKDPPVITLDYTAHIARMAQVKAMLNQQPSDSRPRAPLTPPQSPEIPSSSTSQPPPPPPPPPPQQQPQQQKKQRTWLGFRISHSPSSLRSGRGIPGRRRHSFERRDDPYGGLM